MALQDERVSGDVIGAAMEVHRALGPGLLESVYEECLCHELSLRGCEFKRQVEFPVMFKELRIDGGMRLDMVVGDLVVVELKSVEKLLPVHEAQLLTYLKLGRWKTGLLINFNVALLKHGIVRRVV